MQRLRGLGSPHGLTGSQPGFGEGTAEHEAAGGGLSGQLPGQGRAQPHLSLGEAIEDTWLSERGG